MPRMKLYPESVFSRWERFYRAHFLNSLSGFKPVSLIGTRDAAGVTNLGLFSNIVHLGADPALVGFVNRPRAAAPHTLANIESTEVYTISHVHPGILEKAHQASAKYPDGVSEFEELGLTPYYVEGFSAPAVAESHLRYGLRLQEIIPIRQNDTWFVIGQVEWVEVPEEFVQPDGFIDLYRAESLCSAGLDAYYRTKPLGRFSYAKVGEPPTRIQ